MWIQTYCTEYIELAQCLCQFVVQLGLVMSFGRILYRIATQEYNMPMLYCIQYDNSKIEEKP